MPKAPTKWMVPRAATNLYTGRKELGVRLARAFSFDPLTPPKQQRTFVITGLGGTGKSEVCLKFAEDHQDKYVNSDALLTAGLRSRYWGVFWLDASSIATAEQRYINIGR